MESVVSILRYINNPLSNENIAFGMIAISNHNLQFRFSDDKLNFIYKLNPKAQKILEFSIKKLQETLSIDVKDNPDQLFSKHNIFSKEYLVRLSNYNNGIIKFDKPFKSQIDHDFAFDSLFEKYIGVSNVKLLAERKPSSFVLNIENKFYKPLENKIDIDYTIKKKQLPSLFFDFHIDGLGVNGSLYAAKSIDLNSNKQLGQIRTEIAEYESVLERLKKLAEMKMISSDHHFFLIVDAYKGTFPSYIDLYSILQKNDMPLFEIISSDEISRLTKLIIKNKARKFSEELLENAF